jgi:hypothetical protein
MTAPPFFICGNDRSGTTMLRLILDQGPDAAIPPESMFLTDVGLDGDPSSKEPGALLREVWEHPKVRLWELPGPPPSVPAGAPLARVLAAPFEAYAAKHGKPRWGDKTPHYVHHVDELLRVWPDARFVVMVRDGRDVALSLRPLPFGPNNAWAAAQWWARGIRAGDAARERHPDQVMTVRYEDVVTAPEEHVRRVCDFLDLRFEPRMLDLTSADRTRIVPDQRAWFATLFDGIRPDLAGRWKREMPPRDQAVFAALAGAELAAHGYPVPTQAPPQPTPLQSALYHRHNELMRDVNFIRLRVFQERGRELGPALRRRMQARRGA